LISEIDDCVDSGHFIKRRELLERVSVLRKEIRAIETTILIFEPKIPDINTPNNTNWSLGDIVFFFITLIIFIAVILYLR